MFHLPRWYRLPSKLSTIFQLSARERSKLIVTPTTFAFLSLLLSSPFPLLASSSSSSVLSRGGEDGGFHEGSLDGIVEFSPLKEKGFVGSGRRKNPAWKFEETARLAVVRRALLTLRWIRDKLDRTKRELGCDWWKS